MAARRFLITGGSQGIGAALVTLARQAGHDVMFTGRNVGLIDKISRETGAHGLEADVSVGKDNVKTIEACQARMGGIDVLVNNAAYGYLAEIGSLDVNAMRKQFETNVFGMVDLTNRIVPAMIAQGQGDIVNIASTSGMKGGKAGTAYAASKWAVRGISQCWQTELRPKGIRVVCVCPSEVQTNWGGKTGRNNPNKLYAEDIAGTIMAALAMPRRVLWPELAVFANNPWKED
jgi:3-oxoacyl-[acyl-carrier protein] reductase